jgi:hypothetical protein
VASGKAPSIALAPIENPDVGGVRFRKHPLEIEAGRLNQIAHRLGNRLLLWLRETEENGPPGKARKPKMVTLTRVVGRDMESGRLLTEPITDKDGAEMLVPILPDDDFRQTFQLYERAVRNLLVEQRARAAMGAGKGGAPLDDEKFNAGLNQLVQETIKQMPLSELRELIKARALDVDSLSDKDEKTSGNPASGAPPENVTVSYSDTRNTGVAMPVSEALSDSGAATRDGNGDFLPGLMGDDDDE